MKTESIFIKEINKNITFLIGTNQSEIFDVLNMGSSCDIWFHAKNISSCHVIAILPKDENDNILLNKNDIRYIVKKGAFLCKINTNKAKKINNLEIIYTKMENIEKTDIPGSVNVKNEKTVII